VSAGEGVFAVTPSAAEVASGQTDEDTRQASKGGFALNGFINFDDVHVGFNKIGLEKSVSEKRRLKKARLDKTLQESAFTKSCKYFSYLKRSLGTLFWKSLS
jgi:hypothetical protein